MPWTGIEEEQLQRATEERSTPESDSAEEEEEDEDDEDEEMQDGDGDYAEEQPSPKRARIEGSYGQNDGVTANVQQAPGNDTYQQHQQQQQAVDGNANDQAYQQGQASTGADKVPFFKPNLHEPDEKGENDCFFDTCATRAGGTAYLMKHLRDKHGLVRGDQGRLEGGARKSPKYLTLCPTNWPYKHNTSSSCKACDDIAGVSAVLGQREHESPAICTFCWTYLPTRRDLVAHVDQGPCRSNEGFPQKVAYVRHLYAEALRIPGADEISRAAADQRQAHAEAERAARSEKWQYEQQAMQAWTEQVQRQQQGQQPAQTAVHPSYNTRPSRASATNGEASQSRQRKQQQQQPATYSTQQFTFTSTAPSPATPTPSTTTTTTVPQPPQPQPQTTTAPASTTTAAATDYVPSSYSLTSATAEAMARSIERLTTAIAELTAANTRLVQDVRVRDGQLATRDDMLRKKEERVKALSLENERLHTEVGRLRGEVERLSALTSLASSMDGGGGGGGDADGTQG